MDKISCKTIMELLPLYHDEACCQETKALIKNHLKTCHTCQSYLNILSKDIKTFLPKQEVAKEAFDSKNLYARIKKFWVLIVVTLLIFIPFGYLSVNQMTGIGISFSNIQNYHELNAALKAFQKNNPEKLFGILNFRSEFNSLKVEPSYLPEIDEFTIRIEEFQYYDYDTGIFEDRKEYFYYSGFYQFMSYEEDETKREEDFLIWYDEIRNHHNTMQTLYQKYKDKTYDDYLAEAKKKFDQRMINYKAKNKLKSYGVDSIKKRNRRIYFRFTFLFEAENGEAELEALIIHTKNGYELYFSSYYSFLEPFVRLFGDYYDLS